VLGVMPIPRTKDRRRLMFIGGCHGCGVLFTNPPPTQAQLQQFYAEDGVWAERRAQRVKGPKIVKQTSKPDFLIDAVAPYFPREGSGERSALDFGCGDGKFLNRLKARGWATYGIEPSDSSAFARHRRLTDVPAEPAFDLMVANHVLEHLLDPLGTLRQLAGATRLGGVLFVSVPRLDMLPQHRDLKYCLSAHRHVVSYSETCLRGLLARAGFTTIARLDDPALDEALSEGKPLRLRLVAVRTATVPPLPARPLAAARQALRGYYAVSENDEGCLARFLPVRYRAAMMDAKLKSDFSRRKEREARSNGGPMTQGERS
jgi:SAM-dependent methyltransferase